MLCSAAELELSDDHEGIIELPADAPVGVPYARFAGLDDPVIDVAVTPNRPDAAGVAGIARDLAAAGLGNAEDARRRSLRRRVRLPDARAPRFRARGQASLPGIRLASCPRRHQRPLARMDAEAAARDRAEADQRARRHHQLHHLRSRPPAACVRLRQGRRRPRRAARPRRGKRARARRQDLCARRQHGRHRRPKWRRVDRRNHGRRAFRLRRDYARCSHRKRALGPDQHRPHRPQARDHDRRALPLRARRRSRLLRARLRSRDRIRAVDLRRRAFAHGGGGRSVNAAARDPLPV